MRLAAGRGSLAGASSAVKIPPMAQHPQPLVDRIISLANAGLTRAAIASQVGLTRSAVSGLLHRLDIFTPAPAKPPKPARPRRSYTKAKSSKPLPVMFGKITRHRNLPSVSWADLAVHHCRWPIDNDLWCGNSKTDGSYCAGHAALAYRPAVDRQHRQAA